MDISVILPAVVTQDIGVTLSELRKVLNMNIGTGKTQCASHWQLCQLD